LTFLATANAARYVGAEVIFADVDPDTGVMTPEDLNTALAEAATGGQRAKAAIPVHLTGRAADMEGLRSVAERHGIDLIEDAAHAIGTTYRGDPIGDCRFSRMTVFSFHPVKTIAMGEGGAVTTNDPELRDRLTRLRSHGIVRDPDALEIPDLARDAEGQPNPWYYEMPDPGFNHRATDIHCALALSQLAKLDRFVARRSELLSHYRRALAPLAPMVRMAAEPSDCRPAWHLCVVLIDFESARVDRAAVMRRLKERGIGTQVHYIPVHLQPYYRQRYGVREFPGAETYYRRCLSLPLFPAMGDADVERVVAALGSVLGLR
jgi:dTDP-4-amino-4,6-dideoxygalactose transaminase